MILKICPHLYIAISFQSLQVYKFCSWVKIRAMQFTCTVVSRKYTPPPPSPISPPWIFSAKSCWGIFIPRISPQVPHPIPQKKIHLTVEILIISATGLSSVAVSTANTDYPHQRWTRQLLHESALLPRPSTLKLVSLPISSGASLHLALGDASCLAPLPTDNEVILYWKGGRNRERNCRIPRISPPCILY